MSEGLPAAGPPLTRALIDRLHPEPRPDDPDAMRDLPAALVRRSLDEFLAAGAPGDSVWVFGYGSLLWHPEVDCDPAVPATVRGWHRRFCLWQWRHRGTRDRPGLMLALDRGGACTGAVFRVRGDPRERLWPLWRREMRGDGYRPRWLTVRPVGGGAPVRAVTFVINAAGPRYAGRLPDDVVARHIATACGSKGASAEYLRRLTLTLAGLGIPDRRMARLADLVAREMAAALGPATPGRSPGR